MKFICTTKVRHGDTPKTVKDYKPGDTIDLDPEQAAAMPWAVKPTPETAELLAKAAAEKKGEPPGTLR